MLAVGTSTGLFRKLMLEVGTGTGLLRVPRALAGIRTPEGIGVENPVLLRLLLIGGPDPMGLCILLSPGPCGEETLPPDPEEEEEEEEELPAGMTFPLAIISIASLNAAMESSIERLEALEDPEELEDPAGLGTPACWAALAILFR
jgi:hypothetical protein